MTNRVDGRRPLVVLSGLLTSALALWIVVQGMDVREAGRVLTGAQPLPLLSIVAVVAVQVTLRAWRWSIVLPTARRIPLLRLMPPLLVGYLGNAVLPARLGEPMRAVVIARREHVGTTEALGSVLLERVVDVATLAVIAFMAAMLAGAPAWAIQALGLVAALGVVGMGVLVTVGIQPLVGVADRLGLRRRPLIRDLMTRFVDTLGGRARRSALLGAAGISLLAWLLDATSFWLAGRAVGAEVNYAAAMLIGGVTVLGTAIPSAPGYVGTFELAAAGMARALGVPPAEALAMAVVVHAMTLVPMALGGAASIIFVGAKLGEISHAAESERTGRGYGEQPG